MSFNVGDKVVGVKFSEEHPVGYDDDMDLVVGEVGEVIIVNPSEQTIYVQFDNGGCWWYPLSLVSGEKPKAVKKEKSVVDVVAWAVVNTKFGNITQICYTRADARTHLGYTKSHPRDNYKIVKMVGQSYKR